MIKINLFAEAQQGKGRVVIGPRLGGGGAFGQNLLMGGVVVLAILFVSWRWYSLSNERKNLAQEISKVEQEQERLQAIIQKGEDYKAKKDLLQRKIGLVTQLKRNQQGPVHLLDEISRQLPDFLWLDAMNESGFSVQIQGNATTYNAVSNFYNNLTGSRYFQDVVLGPIRAMTGGVTFSLTCLFVPQPLTKDPETEGSPVARTGT